MRKRIGILGASGSVGLQAADVARKNGYTVEFLTANRDTDTMESLAREFSPKAVAMASEEAAAELRIKLFDTKVKVLSGVEGILSLVKESEGLTVVNSILGKAGLLPTLAVIESGNRLALANKESLVIAGNIVMDLAKEKRVEILPVDSEHSAIFQSLKSGKREEIKRIILTASGGPFYGKSKEALESVTLEQTLAHPTWKMGKKITVDSATLMNKGFEVIEAVHLFGVNAEKVEVVIHRESILHSAVEYIDNTIIGEFSVPDMRSCVQYAVDYPYRTAATIEELDLFSLGKMTFARPDIEAFPLLSLASEAIILGGAVPATLNAADEVAVEAFLEGKIRFTDIYRTVYSTVDKLKNYSMKCSSLDEILMADAEARAICRSFISAKF